MGGRSPESAWQSEPRLTARLPWRAALGVSALVFALLVANGRPIGAGDTRPTERVAASLATSFDLDLDEYPEIEAPFARSAGAHRVSIYPVLSGVLASPLFAAGGLFFALDESGTAFLGKLAAALLSSLAAGAFCLALAQRLPLHDARRAALLLALGTSVWSTSQALWQHPAAVLFLCVALLFLVRAEDDPVWAGRAGLPLAAMVAARHADVALVSALFLAIALRWPRRVPALLSWASPPLLLLAAYQWAYLGSPLATGMSGSLAARFSEPWGIGHLGLLASPAKGLLVFTPVAIVAAAGWWRAWRAGDRWLAAAAATGVAAHWLLIGRWSEWHGGESWGPRMLTDALPLIFLFLPAGFDALPRIGVLLAAASVAVQALGAFCYDYRWERLHQRPPAAGHAELWQVASSPIPFYLERGVLYLAAPLVRDGRLDVRERAVVLRAETGSRATFSGDRLRVTGAERNLSAVRLERGARVVGSRLRLKARWDGLAFRVPAGARQRRLELRIVGRGRGPLFVGERSFWRDARFKEYGVTGSFQVRHPYYFPDSGGADLLITVGLGGGEVDVESVALVPPGEPENVIRLP
jgi:hypothetical protein